MKISITEEQLKGVINEVRNKPEDRVKIYEDDRIVVVSPLTHRSSCKYGSHTPWCTSVPSNDEHFNEYIKHGVLIYFIIRSPYPESKIKEYKFAYYHSYDGHGDEYNGWYDMNDYQYTKRTIKGDNDEITPDEKLIKFLIPDFIFDKVKEYIKINKVPFLKKRKENRGRGVEFWLNDPMNGRPHYFITENNEWYINLRTVPFSDDYKKVFDFYTGQNFNVRSVLTIFYVNKKTMDIYFQELPYFIDIRNCLYHDNIEFPTYFKIKRLDDYEDTPSMWNIFKENFNSISEVYFKMRKMGFDPSENNMTFYVPPEIVVPGVDLYGNINSIQGLIVDVKKDKNGEYKIDVKNKDGNISNGVYYSKKFGVAVQYDKERHNKM